jgi:hypothetical protein
MAVLVHEVGGELGLSVEIACFDNPRVEMDSHYYQPDRYGLIALGYQPTVDVRAELNAMLHDMLPHRDRITRRKDLLIPDIRWDGRRSRVTRLFMASRNL